MTSRPAGAKSRLPIVLLIVVGVGLASVAVCGMLAAIAVPSFMSYVRRAKTGEATTNVRALATAVAVAYEMEHVRPDGSFATRELPPSLPRTPATASSERRMWPAVADPGWRELGFEPADPIYYSYEYARDPDGRGFVARAFGDLDGDGAESRFEVRGTVDASTGELVLEPIAITDELE
ncbi:MAG: hypothetical protein M3Y87_18390 [Myxococcota bacterium]|nr:hypothetical protein [Myxococcota bacterium]